MRKIVIALAALVSVWATAALYFDVRIPWLRIPAAFSYLCSAGAVVWHTKANRIGIFWWAGSTCLVLAWWFSLTPSHSRVWQPDVAELPWVERRSNVVTIHNVRNFDYRTETDFVQHWETRTVDLSQLQGVDLFLTHFGSPLIAHATVSFHFRDPAGSDTFLAISIEQRKTVGQTYSTLRGFFRQYELIYLVADERDVVRLRTNFRKGEDVRLYHTLTKPDDARRLFLKYLQWIEDLRLHPHWYNALTENCTSSVTSYLVKSHVGGLSRWDWRLLLNGLGDQMLYDDGDLATGGLPFKALSEQALINDQAKGLRDDPDFSRDVRLGRPGF
jgi:Domain of unknown function (DUF4105)